MENMIAYFQAAYRAKGNHMRRHRIFLATLFLIPTSVISMTFIVTLLGEFFLGGRNTGTALNLGVTFGFIFGCILSTIYSRGSEAALTADVIAIKKERDELANAARARA